jgi:hypothetical protein
MVAIAACGSSSRSHPAAGAGGAAQAIEFANCMRSHGVPNFPDPSGAGGGTQLPQLSSPALEAAVRDCRALQPGGEGGPLAPSAAQLPAALASARCTRAHRLSQFPDAWTTAPGDRAYLTLGRGEYFPTLGMNEVQSPVFRHAAKAYGVQLP